MGGGCSNRDRDFINFQMLICSDSLVQSPLILFWLEQLLLRINLISTPPAASRHKLHSPYRFRVRVRHADVRNTRDLPLWYIKHANNFVRFHVKCGRHQCQAPLDIVAHNVGDSVNVET